MRVWHICLFELRRILKIRSVVLNLFLLPLLLIFILGTALSSAMGTERKLYLVRCVWDWLKPLKLQILLWGGDESICDCS